MLEKYWEILLKRWRENGRDGFSIPFIIGSQKYLPTSYVDQDIEELVMDIVEQDNVEIYITYCPTINEIILGIRDESKENIVGIFPTIKKEIQSSFFRTNIVDNLGNDIESIIEELINRYQDSIDQGKFSVLDDQKGEMGDYTGNEVEFIKECFNSFV